MAGSRHRLRLPHVAAVGGSVAFLAANTAAGLLIARWLGPVGRGEVSYSFLLVSVGSTVGYFGIDYCATHLLAHDHGRTRPAVRLLLVSAVLAGSVAAAGATVATQLLRPPVAPIAVAVGVVGFTVARVTLSGTFALGRSRWASMTRAATGIAYLGAVVAVLIAGDDPAPVVWAWSGCAVLHAAVLAAGLARRTAPAGDRVERSTFFGLLRVGRASWQSSLAQLVTYRLDQVLVLGVLGAAALGRYSLAAFVMSLLWTVADSVGEIEHPRGAVLDPVDRLRRMKRVAGRVVLVVAALAIGIVATSPIVLPALVGPGYEAVPALVAILAPGTVALAAGKVAGAALLAAGRTRDLRNATLVTSAIVALGTYPAVYYGGLHGAAAFSSAAYTFLGLRLWSLATGDPSGERPAHP